MLVVCEKIYSLLSMELYENSINYMTLWVYAFSTNAKAYEPRKCRAPIDDFGRYKVTSISHNGADVELMVKAETSQPKYGAMQKLILQGFWYVLCVTIYAPNYEDLLRNCLIAQCIHELLDIVVVVINTLTCFIKHYLVEICWIIAILLYICNIFVVGVTHKCLLATSFTSQQHNTLQTTPALWAIMADLLLSTLTCWFLAQASYRQCIVWESKYIMWLMKWKHVTSEYTCMI